MHRFGTIETSQLHSLQHGRRVVCVDRTRKEGGQSEEVFGQTELEEGVVEAVPHADQPLERALRSLLYSREVACNTQT